jgi:hypothetical protein
VIFLIQRMLNIMTIVVRRSSIGGLRGAASGHARNVRNILSVVIFELIGSESVERAVAYPERSASAHVPVDVSSRRS